MIKSQGARANFAHGRHRTNSHLCAVHDWVSAGLQAGHSPPIAVRPGISDLMADKSICGGPGDQCPAAGQAGMLHGIAIRRSAG